MLQLLSNESMGVGDIAKCMSLNPAAVRHHIKALARSSLIEESGEKQSRFGRPTSLYRAIQKPISIEFPKRRYEIITNILVAALLQNVSESKACKTLKAIGYRMGEDIINNLTLRNDIHQWNLQLFKKHLVEEYYNELGAQPLVKKIDEGELVYGLYNCVYFELSRKYVELICDSFDQGLRDALVEKTLGPVQCVRTKCKAKGDPCCEFIIRLKLPVRKKSKNTSKNNL